MQSPTYFSSSADHITPVDVMLDVHLFNFLRALMAWRTW